MSYIPVAQRTSGPTGTTERKYIPVAEREKINKASIPAFVAPIQLQNKTSTPAVAPEGTPNITPLSIGKFVAEAVVRYPVRSALKGALTLAPEKVRENIGEIKPEEDFGKIGKFALGEEPITPLQKETPEAVEGLKESGYGKLAPAIGFIGTTGAVALDLLPFGSLVRKGAVKLAEELTEVGVKSIFKENFPKMAIELEKKPELFDTLMTTLAKEKNPDAIESLLKRTEKNIKGEKVYTPVAERKISKVTPEGEPPIAQAIAIADDSLNGRIPPAEARRAMAGVNDEIVTEAQRKIDELSKTGDTKRISNDLDLSKEEVEALIRRDIAEEFSKRGLSEGAIPSPKVIFDEALAGQGVAGRYTRRRPEISARLNPLIELYTDGKLASRGVGLHESGHYVFDNLFTRAEKVAAIEEARRVAGPIYRGVRRIEGYKGDNQLVEFIVDAYRDAKLKKLGFKNHPLRTILLKIDEVLAKVVNVARRAKAYYDKLPNKEGGFARLPGQIDRSINPPAKKITRDEDVLLRDKLRNQERGAKAGFKAGYTEARESIVRQLTNKFENKIDDIKRKGELKELKTNIKTRDFDRVKEEIVAYAKANLPQSERGKFLSMVAAARTQQDLIKAFVRIDRAAEEVIKKEIVSEISSASKKLLESDSIDIEYRDKIKALLGDFELKGHREATIQKLEATKKYLESEGAKGNDVAMPQRVLEKLQILARTPVEKLTINQAKALQEEMELLTQLGKTKIRTKRALYDNEKELIKNSLLKDATPIETKEMIRKPGETLPFNEKVTNKYREIYNRLKRARLALRPMDGMAELTGMTKMKDRMDLDYGNYLTHNDTFLTERQEMLDKLKLGDDSMERIGIYAAYQQEGGLEKLANSGITREMAEKIELTPAEREYYEFGRKWFESDYPAVKDYMKDVYNKDVGKVKNYVSFQTDFDQMSELDVYDRFGTLSTEGTPRTKTAEKGFTEKRVGAGSQKIKLDFDKILLRHKDDVAYLLNMGQDVKMYSEIVNTPEMREKLGDLGTLSWLEWLDLMARKGGTDGAKNIAWLDTVRRNVGAGVLAFKLSSAMIQLSSFADAAGTIGGRWASQGALKVATSREWRKFVMDNFPEIKAAVGDDVAFMELDKSFLGKAADAGLLPLKKLDGLMRSTTAIGAYEKLAQARGVAVDLANPDKDIIAEATKLVRQSQGSSAFKDQPLAITKGGLSGNKSLDKTLLQFQSFMLGRWENIERQIWRQGFKSGNYGKAIGGITWLFIVSGVIEEGLRGLSRTVIDTLTGKESEEEDVTVQDIVSQAVSNVPIVGNVVGSLTYDSNPVPVISAIEKMLSGTKQTFTGKAAQTKAKGFVDATAGASNVLLGVPGTTQAATIVKNLIGSPQTEAEKKKAGGLPELPKLPKLPGLPKLPKI